ALQEAAWAIAEGECQRALCGGADTTLHPVTWSALVRRGLAASGLVPGEGAALLAVGAPSAGEPVAMLEEVRVLWQPEAIESAIDPAHEIDLAVIAPWGDPPRAALHAALDRKLPSAARLDVTRAVGEALAATPALAWAA